MTATDTIRRSVPSPAPTLAGEGVLLHLAGGENRELRFSSRNILKVENSYDGYLTFLHELETIPISTLCWLLQTCCGVPTQDEALDLLDGCQWRDLNDLVLLAWDKANPPPVPDTEATPDPT